MQAGPDLLQMNNEKYLDMVRKGEVINAYRLLVPISKSLRNSFTADCNFGNSPRREARQKRLIAKAREIAERIDLNVYIQGDPRGCALYLVDKSEQRPGMNYTSGIAIY